MKDLQSLVGKFVTIGWPGRDFQHKPFYGANVLAVDSPMILLSGQYTLRMLGQKEEETHWTSPTWWNLSEFSSLAPVCDAIVVEETA